MIWLSQQEGCRRKSADSLGGLCAAVVTFTRRHRRRDPQSLLASLLCPRGRAPVSRGTVLSAEALASSLSTGPGRKGTAWAEQTKGWGVGCAERPAGQLGFCPWAWHVSRGRQGTCAGHLWSRSSVPLPPVNQ